MSQRDLVAELRAARIEAPAEVRQRVRAIAARGETPARRRYWRPRSLVVLVPIAAAIAGAIVLTRAGNAPERHGVAARSAVEPVPSPALGIERGAAKAAPNGLIPASRSSTRVQQWSAAIGLRVSSAGAVSDAVKHALRITTSLGGHPTSVHAFSEGKSGSADLVLRIPRSHVQEAVTRLSQLGTITSEQADVQDLQAGLDATARRIARLQRRLATLRAEPQTPERDRTIAALTANVERLQRQSAATLRRARFATVALHVATAPPVQPVHHGHGPLHGIAVGAYWAGIGALYAVAFGLPVAVLVLLVVLVVRTVRRRRVDALLSRP